MSSLRLYCSLLANSGICRSIFFFIFIENRIFSYTIYMTTVSPPSTHSSDPLQLPSPQEPLPLHFPPEKRRPPILWCLSVTFPGTVRLDDQSRNNYWNCERHIMSQLSDTVGKETGGTVKCGNSKFLYWGGHSDYRIYRTYMLVLTGWKEQLCEGHCVDFAFSCQNTIFFPMTEVSVFSYLPTPQSSYSRVHNSRHL